ncbi:hypothetical protein ACQRBN_16940 [Bariatricus sp. SGI.154]|uniref:hypothetical protein n=1 Tax=Bariatricus sp. SGI.154 TaxID=3420549 RepID=UPI003CFF73BC
MREKELTISTWIHHISTLIGLSTGIYYLIKRMSTRRTLPDRFVPGSKKPLRSFILFVFTMLQFWAGLKILKDLSEGTSRLKERCKDIHRLSSNRREERRILWGMTFLSSMFKIGFAHLLA